MNINVYGFGFKNAAMPQAMQPPEVFRYLVASKGLAIGKLHRVGAIQLTPNDNNHNTAWWAGIVVKIRDATAITKLRKQSNGKLVITAETLSSDEKLVELSYFIAHPVTGRGLLAHHHNGTSVTAFSGVMKRIFRYALNKKRNEQKLDVAASDGKLKYDPEPFKGQFFLSQLATDVGLEELIKKLKRVRKIKLNIEALETKKRMLRSLMEKATNEVLELTFDPTEDVSELAEKAGALAQDEEVAEIHVSGTDAQGDPATLSSNDNPLHFGKYDFDTLTAGLTVDVSDWSKSINGAKAIAKLVAIANGASTHTLLKTMPKNSPS